MTGLAERRSAALFRGLPLGRLPSADAEALLRQSRVDPARRRTDLPLRAGPPALAATRGVRLQNRPDVNIEAVTVQAIVEELTELYLDVLDPMTRRGARRRGRGSAADGVAARGDAARRRAAGRVRPPVAPAVRASSATTACSSTTRSARRSPRISGRGSGPVAAVPRRRLAAAPRRGRAGVVPGDLALHGRPAVHPPEPDRARGVLPEHRAPLFAGARHAGRRRRDRRDRGALGAGRVRRGPRGLVAARARTAFRVMRDRSGSVVGLPHPGRARSAEPRAARRRPASRDAAGTTCAATRSRAGSASCSTGAGWRATSARRRRRCRPPAGSTSRAGSWSCGPTSGASTRWSGTSRRSGRWSRRSASWRCRASRPSSTAMPYYAAVLDFGPSSIDGWLSVLIAAELLVGEDGDPRPRRAPARPRRAAGRPDGDRVRADVVPLPATRPARRPGDAAARGLGQRLRRRQQRHRGARRLAPAQARRPIGARSRPCAGPGTGSCPPPRADPGTVRAGQATGQ